MSAFAIVALTDPSTLILPRTYLLGDVEIRKPEDDSPEERRLLSEALASADERSEVSLGPRLVTVIDGADSAEGALAEALHRFEETLDILSLNGHNVTGFSLLHTYIYRNMDSGDLGIVQRPRSFKPRPLYNIKPLQFPQIEMDQFIAIHKNNPTFDLCARLVRFLHWTRIANFQADIQLRVLFNWFAMEALLTRSDTDNVGPKILLSLGFPTRKKIADLGPSFMSTLESHPKYGYWKDRISVDIDDVRRYRNDSVHSGFRPWDVQRVDLERHDYVVHSARLMWQALAGLALNSGLRTAEEMWDSASTLVSQHTNFTNWVHNTLLYSLEHRTYELLARRGGVLSGKKILQ